MARRSSISSFLAGIGLGSAAGIAAGMVLAPSSGAQTRRKIARMAGDVTRQGRASLDHAAGWIGKGKQMVSSQLGLGQSDKSAAHPGRHTTRESASETPRARVPRVSKTA